MGIAVYDRTIDAGQEPDRQAVSVVKLDGDDVQVPWWPSLLTQTDPLFQMSHTAIRTYLEAEALVWKGFLSDARAHLALLATGTNLGGADTRNWAQRWIEEHPDLTPAVDPLLGP